MNVFPVADGDTGRNMLGTLQAAVDALAAAETYDLESVWERLAYGALMGARGNSGVILSQLLAGFAEVAEGRTWWEAEDLGRAFRRAAERARRSVPEPVEGTILTIADAMAGGASSAKDVLHCLKTALEAGRAALSNTSNALPVLQEARVVDAGALGYLSMVQGWLDAALGLSAPPANELEGAGRRESPGRHAAQSPTNFYDVEALLYRFRAPDPESRLQASLSALGDSLVLASGPGLLKVHVHTSRPVQLVEALVAVGDIQHMEWWDMRQQVAEREERRLVIVVPEPWGVVFERWSRVLSPEDAEDRDNTLWLAPSRPLERALAVPSLGLLGQLALEYDASVPWEENREQLYRLMQRMRCWVVTRVADGWTIEGGAELLATREEVAAAIRQEMAEAGVVTVYLSHLAAREEASYWQDAFSAELVQLPASRPWMEVVWQP